LAHGLGQRAVLLEMDQIAVEMIAKNSLSRSGPVEQIDQRLEIAPQMIEQQMHQIGPTAHISENRFGFPGG